MCFVLFFSHLLDVILFFFCFSITFLLPCYKTSTLLINNYFKRLFLKTRLMFAVPPEIAPMVAEVVGNPGDQFHLSCIAAKGDTPYNVSWTYLGPVKSQIPPGVSFIRLGKHPSILTIPIISPLHRGEYTCLIANAAGSDNHTTNLIVNGM